ncbi:hypothetical protein [Blastomonas sp. UPD001]|uniref:hypothetical protein n=1 Tax=Blastomonas sp. UPD001 TaxID=2217673 RepID=UPI000E34A69D|nr:hypothetical protein [Blastomonas sp. UPD001]
MDKTAEQIDHPAGDYVLVPVEPTEAMIAAGQKVAREADEYEMSCADWFVADHYRAMIAARPADSDMVERVARAIMSSAHTFPEQAKVYMGYGQAAHAARAAIAAITGESHG